MRIWFIRFLSALAALGALPALVAFIILRSSLPEYEGVLKLKGLSSPVEITRDENAIPHIFAQTKHDAYFGLGFVHAQDRLWQLELTRRAANGRISEAIGADGLPTDTLVAAFDIETIAAHTEARYSPQVREDIAAYVAGINAGIAQHKGPWPPEFLLLGIEPKAWTVQDVSRAGALVTLGFGDWRDELLRARMVPQIGCEALRSLYASPADSGPVSYPEVRSKQPPQPDSCGVIDFQKARSTKTAMLPYGRTLPASNGWAVSGRKTRSGVPLLANDPHGPLTAPADYYLVRMVGPGFDIVGASRPGSPGFASGRNSRIAWGVTDMMIDQADVVIERLDPGHPSSAFLRDGKSVPFAERTVSIPVKGDRPHVLTIRSTPEGPVLSDLDADAARLVKEQLPEGHVAVLKGLDFPEGLPLVEALVGMADALDLSSFRKAEENFQFQQNIFYADRTGAIAMFAAAHISARGGDGFLPTPGWESRFNGRSGLLPPTSLPASVNPERGYVLNANNRTMEGSGRFDSASFEPGWRAIRITDSLSTPMPLGLDDMKQLQGDVRSEEVEALKPLLSTIKPYSPEGRKALAMLIAWDGSMAPDRAEPLIWNAWVRQVSLDLLRPRLGDLTETYLATQRPRLERLLIGEGGWCARSACPEVAAKSLDAALKELAASQGEMQDWKWGNVHQASFTHDIFSYLPLIGEYLVSGPPTGGDAMTVNSGQTSLWSEKPFAQDYGPRYRQIIDLSAPDRSLFMIAPGVSGHPASKWFDHLTLAWAAGRYVTVSGSPSDVAKRGVGRLVLQPAAVQQ